VAGYVRKTVLSAKEVLTLAADLLPERIGLDQNRAAGHGATYSGSEGSVTVTVHPHSLYNEVTAETDQLRTSRMDYEIQKFLNRLPYEVGDRGGPGAGDVT
jgi:hypothetical protein